MWFFHFIISLMNALVYVELEQGIHYSFGGKHNVLGTEKKLNEEFHKVMCSVMNFK